MRRRRPLGSDGSGQSEGAALGALAGAEVCEGTLGALGAARVANLAAKADPLVVDLIPVLAREDLQKVLLRL